MADLTTVPANAGALDGATVRSFKAGAAGAVLNSVFIAADGDVEPTEGDVDAATAEGRGIVVAVERTADPGKTTFVGGDTVSVVMKGPVAGFSGMTPGERAFVDQTVAGALDTTAPAGAGTFTKSMGFAESAEVFYVDPSTEAPVAN